MKNYFFKLSEYIFNALLDDEYASLYYAAENTDFIRFNHGNIGQAGHVKQQCCTLTLIKDQRQYTITFPLLGIGQLDTDTTTLLTGLQKCRLGISVLPKDPFLTLPSVVLSTDSTADSTSKITSQQMAMDIVTAAASIDLVGILANGSVTKGFSNSLGQTNWFVTAPYHFDWSIFSGDTAVKSGSAGVVWSKQNLSLQIKEAQSRLALLQKPTIILSPKNYRSFLAPAAVTELLSLLSWNAFSARSYATKQTPLLSLQAGEGSLNSMISLSEVNSEGVSPPFNHEGFAIPKRISLIDKGNYTGSLCCARTAKEYTDYISNGGSNNEMPHALKMDGGNLDAKQSQQEYQALGTGLYVSNLWYLNYSDMPQGRITGMTRFATLWVQDGVAVGPVAPMRFDSLIGDLLGEDLEQITQQTPMSIDADTYGERSLGCRWAPGILLSKLNFTL